MTGLEKKVADAHILYELPPSQGAYKFISDLKREERLEAEAARGLYNRQAMLALRRETGHHFGGKSPEKLARQTPSIRYQETIAPVMHQSLFPQDMMSY